MTDYIKRDEVERVIADMAQKSDVWGPGGTHISMADLLSALRALPPAKGQGEGLGRPDTLEQFAWHVARDNELARVREALQWIADRCPPALFTEQHPPHRIHYEMAFDAGQRARAALKQEGQG